MSKRILTVLAVASGALALAGCGQASAPDARATATAPATAPATATAAPAGASPAAAPALVPAVAQAVAQAAAPAAVVAAPVGVAVPAPIPAMPGAAQALNGGMPGAAHAGMASQLTVQGYVGPIPSAWTPSQPSSNMRVAQFAVPGAAGAEGGEVAAYFFPPGQGGSHDANIDRWSSQFAGADGKPVAPRVATVAGAGGDVTLVELHGNYARGVGMGPAGEPKPDQTLMVAMVETVSGRITLQMYGPRKTVAAQRDAFLKLSRGFKRPA
jgi:hypothetical protein